MVTMTSANTYEVYSECSGCPSYWHLIRWSTSVPPCSKDEGNRPRARRPSQSFCSAPKWLEKKTHHVSLNCARTPAKNIDLQVEAYHKEPTPQPPQAQAQPTWTGPCRRMGGCHLKPQPLLSASVSPWVGAHEAILGGGGGGGPSYYDLHMGTWKNGSSEPDETSTVRIAIDALTLNVLQIRCSLTNPKIRANQVSPYDPQYFCKYT